MMLLNCDMHPQKLTKVQTLRPECHQNTFVKETILTHTKKTLWTEEEEAFPRKEFSIKKIHFCVDNNTHLVMEMEFKEKFCSNICCHLKDPYKTFYLCCYLCFFGTSTVEVTTELFQIFKDRLGNGLNV